MARKSATKKIKTHNRIKKKQNLNSTSLNQTNENSVHENDCSTIVSGIYSCNGTQDDQKDNVCMCFLRRGQMFLPPSLLGDRNTNNDDNEQKKI